jgi:hypothetical protein
MVIASLSASEPPPELLELELLDDVVPFAPLEEPPVVEVEEPSSAGGGM